MQQLYVRLGKKVQRAGEAALILINLLKVSAKVKVTEGRKQKRVRR